MWAQLMRPPMPLEDMSKTFFFGNLDANKYNAPFLINCTFLERMDSASIDHLVNYTHFLWPNFGPSLLRLFLTDSASYMFNAGKDLKIFFPKMIHVTCFAHALHRVCEQVIIQGCQYSHCYSQKGLSKGPITNLDLETDVPESPPSARTSLNQVGNSTGGSIIVRQEF